MGALARAEAVIDFGDNEDLGPDDDGDGNGVGGGDVWDMGQGGMWDAVSSLRSRMDRHLSDSGSSSGPASKSPSWARPTPANPPSSTSLPIETPPSSAPSPGQPGTSWR